MDPLRPLTRNLDLVSLVGCILKDITRLPFSMLYTWLILRLKVLIGNQLDSEMKRDGGVFQTLASVNQFLLKRNVSLDFDP